MGLINADWDNGVAVEVGGAMVDLSGKDTSNVVTESFNMGFNYARPMTNGFELILDMQMSHRGEQDGGASADSPAAPGSKAKAAKGTAKPKGGANVKPAKAEGGKAAAKAAAKVAAAGKSKLFFSAPAPAGGKSKADAKYEAEESAARAKMEAKAAARAEAEATAAKVAKEVAKAAAASRQVLDVETAVESSLVLFDEVDVVFDDDVGFYAALLKLARQSKCPIVLTCHAVPRELRRNAALVQQCLPWSRPVLPPLAGYLSAICMVRGVRISEHEIRLLCEYYACDLRKLLHTLQCWGLAAPTPAPLQRAGAAANADADAADVAPPRLGLEHTLSLGNGYGRPTRAQALARALLAPPAPLPPSASAHEAAAAAARLKRDAGAVALLAEQLQCAPPFELPAATLCAAGCNPTRHSLHPSVPQPTPLLATGARRCSSSRCGWLTRPRGGFSSALARSSSCCCRGAWPPRAWGRTAAAPRLRPSRSRQHRS